jgi:hypothetical protein
VGRRAWVAFAAVQLVGTVCVWEGRRLVLCFRALDTVLWE